MAKLLAVAAIVAAVTAALTALVFVDPATTLSAVVAIAAGVVLLLQRRLPGYIGGALVIIVGILGLLGAVGYLTFEGGGGGSLGIPADWTSALLVIALVAVPAFATWAVWNTLTPWTAYVGVGAAVVAIILAIVNHGQLVNQANVMNYVLALACIASATPAGMMMRSDAPAPRAAASKPAKPKA